MVCLCLVYEIMDTLDLWISMDISRMLGTHCFQTSVWAQPANMKLVRSLREVSLTMVPGWWGLSLTSRTAWVPHACMHERAVGGWRQQARGMPNCQATTSTNRPANRPSIPAFHSPLSLMRDENLYQHLSTNLIMQPVTTTCFSEFGATNMDISWYMASRNVSRMTIHC